MLRKIVLLALTLALIPFAAMAQSGNDARIKVRKIMEDATISSTVDYYTTDAISLGFHAGESVQGYFSLCWEPTSAGTPEVKVSYVVSATEDGTFVTPQQNDGTDISTLITNTNTVGTGFRCVGGADFANTIRLFPFAKFIGAGAGSNPADTTLDLWLIQH